MGHPVPPSLNCDTLHHVKPLTLSLSPASFIPSLSTREMLCLRFSLLAILPIPPSLSDLPSNSTLERSTHRKQDPGVLHVVSLNQQQQVLQGRARGAVKWIVTLRVKFWVLLGFVSNLHLTLNLNPSLSLQLHLSRFRIGYSSNLGCSLHSAPP